MRRHRTLIGIYLSIFPAMLGNGMIMVILPGRVMEMAGTISAVGGIASAFALSYLLLQLPLGRLGDRFGAKAILAAGYGLCGLAGLLYLGADSATAIYLGRALQGAGEVPLWALAAAQLAIVYPDCKGRVIGGYNALFHLGLCAGPMAGLVVARWGGSENALFVFYSAACFSGAFLVAALVAGSREKSAASSAVPAAPLTKYWGRIWRMLPGISLYGMAYGVMLTVVPAFLASEKGFDNTLLSVFFSLFFLSVSFSQIIAGPLWDRGMGAACMVAGLSCAAVGMAAAAWIDGPAAMAALTVACLGLGGYHVASLAELNARVPSTMKGSISGAYYLSWGIGYFVGPVVTGLACDRFGGQVGLSLPAALLAVAALWPIVGKKPMFAKQAVPTDERPST